MTNIELYINDQLCDIQKPENLGVRLNRVLINPAELNTKDAQYSYSITIPSSPANDAIFGYTSIEEVKNKFNRNYTAQLYVNSLKIFDGRFKVSEIDASGNYKGNLVVPAAKTVKDIFGDKKMNEIEGEWRIDFRDMVGSFNLYNTDKGIPDCIFPMVLYGLLPKVASDAEGTKYTGKTVWDKYVRLGIEDFPPSINCMRAISEMFRSKGYTINGSAFDDARLANLYMSYQNPVGFPQEWNWGHLGKFGLKANWTNYSKTGAFTQYEKKYLFNDNGRHVYVANLLNSSMTNVTYLYDQGTNVIHSVVEPDSKLKRRSNTHITIPFSGLYKIRFSGKIKIEDQEKNVRWRDPYTGLSLLCGESSKKMNTLDWRGYELKLLRDYGEGDFRLENATLDANYYKENMPQEAEWENGAETEYYFPQPDEECVQFIDPIQNANLVSGFRWGAPGHEPKNPLGDNLARIIAIKHGWSWDVKYSQKDKIYSAINSKGYKRWGIIENEIDEDGEDELDENGNVIEYPEEREWQDSKRFEVQIENVAANSIKRNSNYSGEGSLSQVIWLNKGEHLTVVAVSDEGQYKRSGKWTSSKLGWTQHDIEFELEVEPFKRSESWVTVDNAGNGMAIMNWDTERDFQKDYINLFKFLPSEQKVDDWIQNFCKTFNLQLSQKDTNHFELNLKQSRSRTSTVSALDLDAKADISKRSNQPLGLPSVFELGFKINEEEEGFFRSKEIDNIGEKGGGQIETGSLDGGVTSQTSGFSFNWYKDMIREIETGTNEDVTPIVSVTDLKFPVISNKEVWGWGDERDYAEKQKKMYTNYTQRFWYRGGSSVSVGKVWTNTDMKAEGYPDKQLDLIIPALSNQYQKDITLHLDYHNKPDSILDTYFSIIATDDSNYTQVECLLTPDEYDQLDGSKLVRLNGDLYYVSSIEGYDPLGLSKTRLKLIRRV